MAGRTSIIIQGTAWGVQETKNGKRFLRVSVSPGYRDRNGNYVSQPEQYYSVWPAGYANLNPVFDQIAQLRQNQDQFVDVTIVGENQRPRRLHEQEGRARRKLQRQRQRRRHHQRSPEERRTVSGLRRAGRLHAAAAGRIPAVAATGLRPVGQRRQRPGVLTMLHLYHDETPTDVEPVCPKHGCTLYPARPIPCPECEEEAEEEYHIER